MTTWSNRCHRSVAKVATIPAAKTSRVVWKVPEA
jgi:hypothetical protein